MNVELDTDVDEPLYTNLLDENAGVDCININYFRRVLSSLGVIVPEVMFEQTFLDQFNNAGNTDCWHDFSQHGGRVGLLALAKLNQRRPLRIVSSSEGYFIGTTDQNGESALRESEEIFATIHDASVALLSHYWTQCCR